MTSKVPGTSVHNIGKTTLDALFGGASFLGRKVTWSKEKLAPRAAAALKALKDFIKVGGF